MFSLFSLTLADSDVFGSPDTVTVKQLLKRKSWYFLLFEGITSLQDQELANEDPQSTSDLLSVL